MVLLDMDTTPHYLGHILHKVTLLKVTHPKDTLPKVILSKVTLHMVTHQQDIPHKATHQQDILLQAHTHQGDILIMVRLLHIIQGMDLDLEVEWGHCWLVVLLPLLLLMEHTICHTVLIILVMEALWEDMASMENSSMASLSMENLGRDLAMGSMGCLVESSRSGSKSCFSERPTLLVCWNDDYTSFFFFFPSTILLVWV